MNTSGADCACRGKNLDKMLQPSILMVLYRERLHGFALIQKLGESPMLRGCEPASVKSHPLAAEKTIPCQCKIPAPESGGLPVILDAMKRTKASIGDDTALYGLICGPFTLASHLRGSDIFMDMMKDKDYVKDLMAYCEQVSVKMCEMYIDAGMDVIAVVDLLISQVSPKMIEKLLSETFIGVFDYIRDIAEYRVYKYFIKEDIARTRKMGIANLPTMCIDGEQKFISIIPSREELVDTVKAAAAAKAK